MPSKTLHLKTLRNHLLSSPPLPSPPSPFLLQNPSTKIRHQTLILLRIASSSQMLFSILLAFLFSSIHPAFSDTPSPAIFLTVCAQNQTADAESFDVSFVDAMEKIYRNITVSGFAAASSGSANLTVFVLGQCFSYLSSVNCQLCYSQSRVKLPHCLPSSSGRIFLDGCFLEYADRNTSDLAVDSADAFACSKAAVRDPRFADLTEKLVGNLTGVRADRNEYYRAGSVQVSSDLRVYGMAQCWRSLNASACAECLENGRQSIVRHCLPSDEAKAMNAGCFIRYSTDPFYLSQAAGDGAGSSSAHHSVIIAVTTVLGSLVLIGIALLWRMRRSFCGYVRDDAGENREIIEAITKSHLSYKYEDLGKATNNFSQNNKLGQGGYGAVYKGILPDGKEIAVKRLFFNTTNWVDQFFNEVTLISQVQHKNLVKLMGCSVEGPESLLVYEFLSNTSLDHYLFDSFLKTALDWQRRFNIIVGTAEGLAYLHSASAVRIIHRDIKASNILLDDKFRPKISDFGLARYFKEDQSHLSTGIAGTFGYMAPEYIIHGQLTERADIYSYGVLVLEILAGRKNQSSIMTSEDGHSLMQQIWQHHNSNTLLMLLDSGLQGACSEIEVMKAFRVGLLCVQASPSLRPPMWKVVEMLTGRLNDLPEPARPPFLHGHGFGSQSQSRNSESSDSKSPLIKNINFDEDRMSVNQISVSMFQGR